MKLKTSVSYNDGDQRVRLRSDDPELEEKIEALPGPIKRALSAEGLLVASATGPVTIDGEIVDDPDGEDLVDIKAPATAAKKAAAKKVPEDEAPEDGNE